ncbi:MAG TPA: redoxin domain-containing protein [Verrucomicrobiae bacterium]|nr:redoxin domain-containing protein [Verrucomicrobiae bacterium]
MNGARRIAAVFWALCIGVAACSCIHQNSAASSNSNKGADARIAAKVYIFVNNDCPIANRYSPEIRRLYEQYAPRGVAFWLVHCDPQETEAGVREHNQQYSLTLPIIMDRDQSLARRCRAEVVPSASVFSDQGGLVYHGRIDDRLAEIGRERPQPSRHDLAEALDAILTHRPVAVAETRAVGCYISNVPRLSQQTR